mmetsp:Transcript_2197/g.4932  ORF Transcript_2197/g.4932 Transcript_2197/m.4932 type:complete len:343 (+) Transcript_2197:241-1269(+)
MVGAPWSILPDRCGEGLNRRRIALLREDVVEPGPRIVRGGVLPPVAPGHTERVFELHGQLPMPVVGPNRTGLVEFRRAPILECVEVAHVDDRHLWPLRVRLLHVGNEIQGILKVDALVPTADGVGPIDQESVAAHPVLQQGPAEAAVCTPVLDAILEANPQVLVIEDVAVPELLLRAACAESVVPARRCTRPCEDVGLLFPLLRDHGDVGTQLRDGVAYAISSLRLAEGCVVHIEGRELDSHIALRLGGRMHRGHWGGQRHGRHARLRTPALLMQQGLELLEGRGTGQRRVPVGKPKDATRLSPVHMGVAIIALLGGMAGRLLLQCSSRGGQVMLLQEQHLS